MPFDNHSFATRWARVEGLHEVSPYIQAIKGQPQEGSSLKHPSPPSWAIIHFSLKMGIPLGTRNRKWTSRLDSKNGWLLSGLHRLPNECSLLHDHQLSGPNSGSEQPLD